MQILPCLTEPMGKMETPGVCAARCRFESGSVHKQKTKKMKRIIVDHGTRKRLKDEGYGSYPTIRGALNCLSNTEVAMKIRQRALQLGGVVMETEHVAVVKKREA